MKQTVQNLNLHKYYALFTISDTEQIVKTLNALSKEEALKQACSIAQNEKLKLIDVALDNSNALTIVQEADEEEILNWICVFYFPKTDSQLRVQLNATNQTRAKQQAEQVIRMNAQFDDAWKNAEIQEIMPYDKEILNDEDNETK